MITPRLWLALLVVSAAGCSFPQHVAVKIVQRDLPVTGLREVSCASHNGAIAIEARPNVTEVSMRVEVSVRGHTPEQAQANLDSLDVQSDMVDGRLRIEGKYDRAALGNMSPSFAFTLVVPANVALTLSSHNGEIRSAGTVGPIHCETHNGDITIRADTRSLQLSTHNGGVRADIEGRGSLDGSISTHNGAVAFGVGGEVSTQLSVSTHNGSVRLDRPAEDVRSGRNRLQCRLGDGAGRLEISTHNGSVEIR